MQISKVILIVLAFSATIGCCQKSEEKEQVVIVDAADPSLDLLIDSIANHPTVDEEYVGIVGTASEQYIRFKNLAKQATQKQLVELTNDESANVRAYSFWALAQRKYGGIDSLLQGRIGDTSSIRHFSGCTINEYAIKDFYTSVVSRQELSQK